MSPTDILAAIGLADRITTTLEEPGACDYQPEGCKLASQPECAVCQAYALADELETLLRGALVSDRDLRRLERAAACGDAGAAEALGHARLRAGFLEPDLRRWLTVQLRRARKTRQGALHLARIGPEGAAEIRSLCGSVSVNTWRVRGVYGERLSVASMRGRLHLTWSTAASEDGWGLCSRCYAGHLKLCRKPCYADKGWRLEWNELCERAAAIGFPYPEDSEL